MVDRFLLIYSGKSRVWRKGDRRIRKRGQRRAENAAARKSHRACVVGRVCIDGFIGACQPCPAGIRPCKFDHRHDQVRSSIGAAQLQGQRSRACHGHRIDRRHHPIGTCVVNVFHIHCHGSDGGRAPCLGQVSSRERVCICG
jgi:hypothetical protein